MKRTTLTLAAGALASLMLAGTAAGDHVPEESNIVKISAALAYGQEVPQPTPGAQQARGSFTGTVKWIGNGAEFTWQLAFRDLTGPATGSAHPRRPARRGRPRRGAAVQPVHEVRAQLRRAQLLLRTS